MRLYGFKELLRRCDRIAFINKASYVRFDMSRLSVTGPLPSLWIAEVNLPDPDPGIFTRGITT